MDLGSNLLRVRELDLTQKEIIFVLEGDLQATSGGKSKTGRNDTEEEYTEIKRFE